MTSIEAIINEVLNDNYFDSLHVDCDIELEAIIESISLDNDDDSVTRKSSSFMFRIIFL